MFWTELVVWLSGDSFSVYLRSQPAVWRGGPGGAPLWGHKQFKWRFHSFAMEIANPLSVSDCPGLFPRSDCTRIASHDPVRRARSQRGDGSGWLDRIQSSNSWVQESSNPGVQQCSNRGNPLTIRNSLLWDLSITASGQEKSWEVFFLKKKTLPASWNLTGVKERATIFKKNTPKSSSGETWNQCVSLCFVTFVCFLRNVKQTSRTTQKTLQNAMKSIDFMSLRMSFLECFL